MQKYFFFDTETTGLPLNYKAPVENVNNWPRLVQLAYKVCDDTGAILKERSVIIKPDGFLIPKAASDIHRVTFERAMAEGEPLPPVLYEINDLINEVDHLVAHNIDFDKQIVGAEFIRHRLHNPIPDKHRICTMLKSTPVCKLPGKFAGTYKWPKLSELHQYLFGVTFEESHDAGADIAATVKCFFELKRRAFI